jgi:outer membrane protein TolC
VRTAPLLCVVGALCAPAAALARTDDNDDDETAVAGAGDESADAERIGLRDALRLALRENPTFAAESADVDIAEGELQQARGADDWVLEAGLAWASIGRAPLPGHLAEDPYERRSAHLALSRRLPTGGTIGVALDTRIIPGESALAAPAGGPGAATPEEPADTYAPVARAVLVQPLLRGFGSDAAAAGKNRARAGRDAQRLEQEAAAGNLVRDVAHAYWELAYAGGDLAIRRRSLALAREHRRVTKAGVNAKRLAPVELSAVDQTIAVREEEMLLAELSVAERSLELRRLLGVEIDPTAPGILASDGLEERIDQPDLDGALAAAYRANAQLQALGAQREAADIEVAAAEDTLLPSLDLTAGVASYGSAESLDAALDQVSAHETLTWTAGIVFTLPLGNNGAEGAHKAARGRARRARLVEADLRAQIAVAVARSVKQIRSAGRRIDVDRSAIELAEQNLDAEAARWQAGHSTNFDVLKRQDELAQSQLRLARARTDYLKAVATLEALTGDILARYDLAH